MKGTSLQKLAIKCHLPLVGERESAQGCLHNDELAKVPSVLFSSRSSIQAIRGARSASGRAAKSTPLPIDLVIFKSQVDC